MDIAQSAALPHAYRETEAAAAMAAAEAPLGAAAGSVYDETHGGVFPKFCGERPGTYIRKYSLC